MKGNEHWVDRYMDMWRRNALIRFSLVAFVVFLSVASGGVSGQGSNDNDTFVFFETPPADTSNTTATFRWGVVAANGSNPCAVDQCVNQCQLDDESFQNCSTQVAKFFNLTDGVHIFRVLVSTSRGVFYTNNTTWTVDTIHPTAVVTAGTAYTNALNVSVGIKFSEPCISPGFRCPNVSDCDVYVSGPGIVIPSSLVVHSFGLEYSITVALFTTVVSGKVEIRMSPPRKGICSDAAGNAFVRNASSIFTLRFNRAIPTVNMWTPVQDSQVEINNSYMTISATNSSEDLILYLDFSDPMITPASQLLNSLQINHGTLSLRSRRRFQRKYFAFLISNVSDFSIISISLPANSSNNIYGTPVLQTSNVTLLYASILERGTFAHATTFDSLHLSAVDSTPLSVSVSTTSLAKTKNHLVPFLIQFNKPAFVFGAENVTISGGNLTRFREVSKSTYAVELYVADDNVASVAVGGNVTYDIAGNPNSPSNVIQVRHYTEPSWAVALYSFSTAGLIATALASGALSISSATLAAAGVLNTQMSGSDPSRNLLGMATHLQLFALSDWLAVSFPVEYRETVRGLRWMIPHINPPWQKQHNSPALNNPLLQQTVQPGDTVMKLIRHSRRKVRAVADYSYNYGQHVSTTYKTFKPIALRGRQVRSVVPCPSCLDYGEKDSAPVAQVRGSPCTCDEQINFNTGIPKSRDGFYEFRRRLGPNMTAYGPALGTDEYALYFDNSTSDTQLRNLFHRDHYTGWRDFSRNMFWLGVVGGGLIALHLLLLPFLRWRTKTSVRGALTIPRFELFLLILAIPCVCQAAAFIIRGGTTVGIIIGVLLLAIPAAFLLSVVLFLIIAILMGSLVQYKEVVVKQQQQQGSQPHDTTVRLPRRSKLLNTLAGPNTAARWVRKDGLAPTFLPRYGLLFEDRKGPPKLIVLDSDVGGSFPKWVESGSNGVGRMRALNSDDESDEVSVSVFRRILGGVRAAYLSLDISRRIVLGVIFGAFSRSDKSWVQVSVALAFTAFQFLVLILFKPFIKRGVQFVESISLACETALFVVAAILLAVGHPSDDHLGLGILLLALLLISFVSQLVNEWYALMKQLLRLSPTQEPSLKVGVKMLTRGLVLPLIPRGHWGRFITPNQPLNRLQPRTGLVPVVPLSPDRAELPEPELIERARRSSTSVHTGSPLIALGPEAAIPGYDPGSPAFIDPRNAVTEEAVVSGEIKGDSSASAAAVAAAGGAGGMLHTPEQQHQQHLGKSNNGNWGSQWSNKSRSMEGKRSTRGVKSDPKSSEMKMLRNIAKASFPRWRKHEEVPDPGLEISSPVPSNLGTGAGGATRKLSSSSRVGPALGTGEDEHGYGDDSTSDRSSDEERYHSRRRPQLVGESSIDVLGNTSRGVTPHSSSSFDKASRGSGPLETTLSGGSLPLRELIQER